MKTMKSSVGDFRQSFLHLKRDKIGIALKLQFLIMFKLFQQRPFMTPETRRET